MARSLGSSGMGGGSLCSHTQMPGSRRTSTPVTFHMRLYAQKRTTHTSTQRTTTSHSTPYETPTGASVASAVERITAVYGGRSIVTRPLASTSTLWPLHESKPSMMPFAEPPMSR